jgi:hypothetical protein
MSLGSPKMSVHAQSPKQFLQELHIDDPRAVDVEGPPFAYSRPLMTTMEDYTKEQRRPRRPRRLLLGGEQVRPFGEMNFNVYGIDEPIQLVADDGLQGKSPAHSPNQLTCEEGWAAS